MEKKCLEPTIKELVVRYKSLKTRQAKVKVLNEMYEPMKKLCTIVIHKYYPLSNDHNNEVADIAAHQCISDIICRMQNDGKHLDIKRWLLYLKKSVRGYLPFNKYNELQLEEFNAADRVCIEDIDIPSHFGRPDEAIDSISSLSMILKSLKRHIGNTLAMNGDSGRVSELMSLVVFFGTASDLDFTGIEPKNIGNILQITSNQYEEELNKTYAIRKVR